MSRSLLIAAVTLCLVPAPRLFAAPDIDELRAQQDRQRQIQEDTDQIVRRMTTMLRVMQFYGIDKSGEKQMLEEMSGALRGLSKQQMAEVIRKLGEAAKATDEKKSEQAVEKAYEGHRRIL